MKKQRAAAPDQTQPEEDVIRGLLNVIMNSNDTLNMKLSKTTIQKKEVLINSMTQSRTSS